MSMFHSHKAQKRQAAGKSCSVARGAIIIATHSNQARTGIQVSFSVLHNLRLLQDEHEGGCK